MEKLVPLTHEYVTMIVSGIKKKRIGSGALIMNSDKFVYVSASIFGINIDAGVEYTAEDIEKELNEFSQDQIDIDDLSLYVRHSIYNIPSIVGVEYHGKDVYAVYGEKESYLSHNIISQGDAIAFYKWIGEIMEEYIYKVEKIIAVPKQKETNTTKAFPDTRG